MSKSEQQRIILGQDEAAEVVATMAGDGDVTVWVGYSKATGKQVVQIDTEDHAQFVILLNDGRIATVGQGDQGVVDRFDDLMEFAELDAIRQEAERRIAALPLIYSGDLEAGSERARKFTSGELRRETVTISWSETVHYNQDVTIDVPGDFTGNLADLVNENDDAIDDVDGVPEDFRTGWLKGADMSSIESVYDRVIHDVTPVKSDG